VDEKIAKGGGGKDASGHIDPKINEKIVGMKFFLFFKL
jgi:hypothetical protein